MSTRTRTRTSVRSRPIADPGPLLSLLPTPDSLAWTRGNDGFVAWGQAARLDISGPHRFANTAKWWRELVDSFDIDDNVGLPGSGPVAFASFAFDDGPADGPAQSVVIVPSVVFGRRDGAAWVTTIGDADEKPARIPVSSPGAVSYSDGDVSSSAYERAVASAIERIADGSIDKVVLARDLVARAENPIDARSLLASLSRTYPTCWTFAVDGLVGATPELLVRRTGDHVVSRVLAGTTPRSTDAVVDAGHSARLIASQKDRIEHDLAVQSVSEALGPFCSDLVVPRTPEVVRLANVQHLLTDVTGRLANGETALELAGALHPTAAVCGTPTVRARTLIGELEAMDRGRYAGPVGWIDSRGDGAFGIALRCAQIEGDDQRALHMFAGCGIVKGSLPVDELAESQTKLLAMREALECQPSPSNF